MLERKNICSGGLTSIVKRNKHFWKSSASPVLWLLAWNGNSFLSPQVLTDQVKEPIKRNANCKSGNHSLWHKMHYSMKSGSYSCFNFALRYRIIKLYISVNMFVHIYLLVTCKQSSLTFSSLSVWLLGRRCQGEKKMYLKDVEVPLLQSIFCFWHSSHL